MNQLTKVFLIIIFSLIFGIIAFFHESQIGKWFDTEIYNFIFSIESPISTHIFRGVTVIGEVWTMILLSLLVIVLLKIKKHNKELIFFAITMILSGTLNPILKNIFDRERPTILRLVDISGFSFPSGHAMGTTAFFGSLIYIIMRLSTGTIKPVLISICIIFILVISISRIYLGVHYPTDVIAGILGGTISILITQLILQPKLNKN